METVRKETVRRGIVRRGIVRREIVHREIVRREISHVVNGHREIAHPARVNREVKLDLAATDNRAEKCVRAKADPALQADKDSVPSVQSSKRLTRTRMAPSTPTNSPRHPSHSKNSTRTATEKLPKMSFAHNVPAAKAVPVPVPVPVLEARAQKVDSQALPVQPRVFAAKAVHKAVPAE